MYKNLNDLGRELRQMRRGGELYMPLAAFAELFGSGGWVSAKQVKAAKAFARRRRCILLYEAHTRDMPDFVKV